MEDLTITINLLEKTLSFSGSELELSDSFNGIRIPHPKKVIYGGCKPGETCLQLLYKNNKDIYNGVLDSIKHMKDNKLGKKLIITTFQDNEDLVQIVGKYRLKITNH